MADVKLCPHCGGKMFAARIIRGCIVESTEEGFKVLKENADRFEIEVVKCGRCKKDVTNDELTTGVACKTCGRVVNPSELSEDGVCSVCNAQKERSELANASREDLIRMLLEAERKAKAPVASESKQNKVEFVEVTPEATTEPASDLVPEVPKEPKKTKRSASRKKTEEPVKDSVADTPEPMTTEEPVVPVAESETVVATQFVADQQVAPFPDIPDMQPTMNPPEMVAPSPADEQLGVNNFQMFQSDEKI